MGGEVGVRERLGLRRQDLGVESLQVDVPVAGHADGQRFAAAVGVAQHDEDVLQRVGRRPLAVGAAQILAGVQQVDERVDRGRVRRVLDVRRGAGRRAAAPAATGTRTASTLAA